MGGITDDDQDNDQDEAAQAFQEMTAEVAVLRRAVEAMAEKEPVDYAPTLGAITKRLDEMVATTKAMAASPALMLTPETYAAQLRRATEDAARPVSSELQRVQTLTGQMERALGGIRTRQEQRAMVLKAGVGGLVIGVAVWALLLPAILQALPKGWHVPERAAAYVVGEDRWTAGQAMMASVDIY